MKRTTQLTHKQTDALMNFVRHKEVKFLDVKYELVDHLASDIEAQLDHDPHLGFEEGLNIAFEKFPSSGFQKIVKEKEKSLKKYWRGRLFGIIMSYFTIPKIIFTLLVFSLCLNLDTLTSPKTLWWIGITSSLAATLLPFFGQRMHLKHSSDIFLFTKVFDHSLSFLNSFTFWVFYALNSTRIQAICESDVWYMNILEGLLSACITWNVIVCIASLSGDFKKIFMAEIRQKYSHLNVTNHLPVEWSR